jgi:thymidylate kinase
VADPDTPISPTATAAEAGIVNDRRSRRAPRVDDLHPRVRSAFEALDVSGVEWALLRGFDRLAAGGGDIDLLADPSAAERLDALLASAEFTRLPARGHGSHRFYVSYDAQDDVWPHLDVVTEVAFGRLQEFCTDLAEPLLARRQRVASVATLEPGDAFWHMLLHDLLRTGEVADGRRELLRSLVREADASSPLAVLVADLRPTAVRGLISAVGNGDWDGARRVGSELRQAWRLRHAGNVMTRSVVHRIGRHVPVAGSDMAGVSVAVLGPDGAGKTTLADGVRASIPIPARYVYLGIWRESRLDQRLSRIIGARLALRLMRLVSKSMLIRYHRRLGRVVLLDRFTCDADLPSPDLDWKGRISAQLVRRTCADPDLIILLDAPVELMYARKGEHGVRELEVRRRAYLEMADRFPQMVVLDASEQADQVRRRATAVLWERWSRRMAFGRRANGSVVGLGTPAGVRRRRRRPGWLQRFRGRGR